MELRSKVNSWLRNEKLTKFSIHNLTKYLQLMLQRYISCILFKNSLYTIFVTNAFQHEQKKKVIKIK